MNKIVTMECVGACFSILTCCIEKASVGSKGNNSEVRTKSKPLYSKIIFLHFEGRSRTNKTTQ